jgi:drug/metabolite transporter (DMT)-like permease
MSYAGPVAGDQPRALAAVIAANIIWGTTFVATKPLLDELPPATLATVRVMIALAVLVPILLMTGRAPALGRGPALLGVVGVACFFLLQNMGLDRTSATNGALLQSFVPVATVMLAFVALGEALSIRRMIALALSVSGALIIVGFDSGLGSSVSLMGDLLILASALVLAGYFVLGRRLFAETDVLSLVAGTSVYSLIVLLPASMVEYGQDSISRPDSPGLLRALYLGIGASAFAYYFEGRGLRHLEAGQVALLTNLGPLIGVGAAALVLGEALAVPQILGGSLVLAGAWMTMRSPHRNRPPRQLFPRAGAGLCVLKCNQREPAT